MVHSMTAFARKENRDEQAELIWEIRSVNHRYLEIFVRLPEELRAIEPLVREQINRRLGRGKIDCSLRFKPLQAAVAGIEVDERLATQLLAAAGKIEHLLHEAVPPSVMDVLRWPGVMTAAPQDLSPVQEQATQLLEQALDVLIETRQREGELLAELIQQRCTAMRGQVDEVKQRIPAVLQGIRERLRSRLSELSDELDAGRVEQEMVLLTQRLDVDEELDRLYTHLGEVERVLGQQEPIGRRLDFLMQELNREVNTLTSKSSDAEMTRLAVEMKVLIEQMREQIQNIE